MSYQEFEFGPYDKAEKKARKAYELYEQGNLAHAIHEIEEAIEINPSNGSWHFNKGLALDSMQQYDEAIKEYQQALECCPEDVEILNCLAVNFTRTGHYDLALNVFEYIESLDPDFEPCYCNRIITYTEMEEYELAEQMFYMAQQINENCPVCFYNIGNSLFVRGKYERAIQCWKRAEELDAKHPQINYRIAQSYWARGEIKQAHKHFLKEIRNNPGDTDVILDMGLFLLEINDTESAKEKFRRIVELDPDSAKGHFYLGEVNFNEENYETANHHYNCAVRLDEHMCGPRLRMAQICHMKGQTQLAAAYLNTEIKLDIEDCHVLVSMGSMYLEIDDIDKAMKCLLRAINCDNSNYQAYYYLAVANAMRERYEDAIEFFTNSLEINPDHFESLRDSCLVYVAMGRKDDALKKLEKAKYLFPENKELKHIEKKIKVGQITNKISDIFSKVKPDSRNLKKRRSYLL